MRLRTIVMATLVVLLCAFYTWKHYEFKSPAVVDVPYKTTDTIIPLPATILRDSITYFDARIAEIDKEIEHREEMNSIIAQMIQDHIKINNQLRKINNDLREHLAGQNWKINSTPWGNYDSTPNTNIDLGNIQIGNREEPWPTPTKPITNIGIGLSPLDSLTNQTITTGGSSVLSGPKGGMGITTGGNIVIGPSLIRRGVVIKDSLATIGSNNAGIISDTSHRK